MLRIKARTQEGKSWTRNGETCVLYCSDGRWWCGARGGWQKSKYRHQTQQGKDGKLDGQSGRVVECMSTKDAAQSVTLLMCWRVSLPVDTTAETGPTPPHQHGGMHRLGGEDLL